jgi:hypothetical protein
LIEILKILSGEVNTMKEIEKDLKVKGLSFLK